MSRNPRFQKLLTDLYPVGRDNFTIDFKLDKFSDVEYNLLVTPKFPLNLILTQRSIDSYLFVSSQLQKIRKSLWEVTALRLKGTNIFHVPSQTQIPISYADITLQMLKRWKISSLTEPCCFVLLFFTFVLTLEPTLYSEFFQKTIELSITVQTWM